MKRRVGCGYIRRAINRLNKQARGTPMSAAFNLGVTTMATIKQLLAMSSDEREANQKRILDTLTNVPCAAVDFHAAQLKGWSTKLCGPKPTLEMIKLNYILDGGRRAGDEPMWLAMTARTNGATVGEYMRATSAGGAAHNNAAKYNTERNGTGWLVRVPLANSERAGRWVHLITDKGEAQLAKRVAALTGTAEAKPVKAVVKATPKRNKAKAKPVTEAPVADTAPVTDTVSAEPVITEVTPQAFAALAEHFSK